MGNYFHRGVQKLKVSYMISLSILFEFYFDPDDLKVRIFKLSILIEKWFYNMVLPKILCGSN